MMNAVVSGVGLLGDQFVGCCTASKSVVKGKVLFCSVLSKAVAASTCCLGSCMLQLERNEAESLVHGASCCGSWEVERG